MCISTKLFFIYGICLYNQVFRMQTERLVCPHEAQINFFSYCVLIQGVYPLNAEGVEMSCGTCITREVTEFIIPVARQRSHSITVGCHTAHISHRCRILMGDTFQLYFSFSVYLTHSQWAKPPPTSRASKLSFSHIHYTKLC